MRPDGFGDDAEVVFDGADGRIDVFVASAYEQSFRVRYTRWEFVGLLWRGWIVLFRTRR